MAKPTEIEKLRVIVEDTQILLRDVIKPCGDYYHNVMHSYFKEDRGLNELLNFLYYIAPDANGVLSHMKKKLEMNSPYIPACEKNLEIMRKIEEGIDEVKKICKEAMKREIKTLLPQEFVRAMYHASNVRIFLDYLYASYSLIHDILIENKGIQEVLKKYEPTIKAFIEKKLKNEDEFYMGLLENYSFLTYFVIDSHDNSILRDLKTRKDKKILIKKIPEKGLEEILYKPREKVEEKMREALKWRAVEKVCLPSMLANRVDKGKIVKYYKELYNASLTYIS
jgi:hypothetical protein